MIGSPLAGQRTVERCGLQQNGYVLFKFFRLHRAAVGLRHPVDHQQGEKVHGDYVPRRGDLRSELFHKPDGEQGRGPAEYGEGEVVAD